MIEIRSFEDEIWQQTRNYELIILNPNSYELLKTQSTAQPSLTELY